MLKKLRFTLFFMAVALITQLAATDQEVLEHITQAKKEIIMEMQAALAMNERAAKHYQKLFQNDYAALREECLTLLHAIIKSPEFATTVDQVTDAQLDLITAQLVPYNDIIIDPSAYPLEQKIKNELSLAHFDEAKEQFFNVLYVVFAVVYGSKKLLEKLAIEEKRLLAEHQALNTSTQLLIS